MFTRQLYQNDYYNTRVAQSVQPLLYHTNPQQLANCAPCEMPYGSVASRQRYSGSAMAAENVGHITDVESILRHQSSASRLGSGREHFYAAPVTTPLALSQKTCFRFAPEESLTSHPKQHYREMDGQLNRIFQREHDASDYTDTRGSIDTRQMAKDSYKMKLPKPLAFTPNKSLLKKA
jgi:hypothetical protein